MKNADTIAATVRQFLRPFDDALRADLAAIVRSPVPDEADMVDFEIDFDRRGFEVVGAFMDNNAGDHGPLHFLLRDRDLSFSTEIADALAHDDGDASADRAITQALVRWLAEHWLAAGGAELAMPAYARRHDDLQSYDLVNGKWIDDTEKWD